MANKEPMGLKFFGDIDRNFKGEIKSEIPAWSMFNHIEQLEEDANYLRSSIEQGFVKEKIGEMKEKLAKLEAQIDQIVGSKPELTEKQKSDLAKDRLTIGNLISEAMFTRSDMEMGWADPHEEARRMSTPYITIGEDFRLLALACGVKKDHVEKGKVSRTDLEKMYKIISAALEEDCYIEKLRKDKVTSRTSSRVSVH